MHNKMNKDICEEGYGKGKNEKLLGFFEIEKNYKEQKNLLSTIPSRCKITVV